VSRTTPPAPPEPPYTAVIFTSTRTDGDNGYGAMAAWKQVHEHLFAQACGRTTWYADYRVQVATVTRSYGR
jgi:hypothetical protein